MVWHATKSDQRVFIFWGSINLSFMDLCRRWLWSCSALRSRRDQYLYRRWSSSSRRCFNRTVDSSCWIAAGTWCVGNDFRYFDYGQGWISCWHGECTRHSSYWPSAQATRLTMREVSTSHQQRSETITTAGNIDQLQHWHFGSFYEHRRIRCGRRQKQICLAFKAIGRTSTCCRSTRWNLWRVPHRQVQCESITTSSNHCEITLRMGQTSNTE